MKVKNNKMSFSKMSTQRIGLNLFLYLKYLTLYAYFYVILFVFTFLSKHFSCRF